MSELDEYLKNLNNAEVEYYCKCNPDKKDNTFKQLKDFDYLANTFKESRSFSSNHHLKYLVEKDIDQKMKVSGATKITSKSFKEKYWNKYHYIKQDNLHIMYTIYGKQGQYSITFLERIVTSRGSLYAITLSDSEAVLIHHHVLERYEERAGVVSNDRLEAIKWILKEFNHAHTVFGEREFDKGFLFKDVYCVMASGMMLGNLMRGFLFFKTYIPMNMLDKDQDNMHEEAWKEIEKERAKQKRNAPVI